MSQSAEQERLQLRKAEFAEHVRRHQVSLFSYIRSLVRNLHDADDIFQQTTLVLWQKFEEFDPQRSFLAWACGVARWKVINFVRDRNRQRLYFGDELTLLLIEAQAEIGPDEAEDRRLALNQCVGKLREDDRQLIQECYGPEAEETAVVAVAERHGRSPQSVYNSLRRIRRVLFDCISRTLAAAERPRWIGP